MLLEILIVYFNWSIFIWGFSNTKWTYCHGIFCSSSSDRQHARNEELKSDHQLLTFLFLKTIETLNFLRSSQTYFWSNLSEIGEFQFPKKIYKNIS